MLASIIIRTYNSRTYVKRAIRSARRQNFPRNEFEIIVIDDGSTDDTEATLEKYARDIRYIKTEHIGAIPAANLGVREARGAFVSLLDADDEYNLMFLHAMTGAIARHDADFAYCNYREIVGPEVWHSVSCAHNLYNTVAGNILFRRERLIAAGLFNEALIFPEYDLLLKTATMWRGVHVPRGLFLYYRHPGSITASHERVQKGMDQLRALHPDKLENIARIRTY